MSDLQLLRDVLVDVERIERAVRRLEVRVPAVVRRHHVVALQTEELHAVDEVVGTRTADVDDVVETDLGDVLVRSDRRRDVREVEADLVVQTERELQFVLRGIERRVAGLEGSGDDAADRAEVGVDADERVALDRLPRLEGTADDGDHLDGRHAALGADRLGEVGELQRLLGDVAAEIGRDGLGRTGVFTNHDFMLSHDFNSLSILICWLLVI